MNELPLDGASLLAVLGAAAGIALMVWIVDRRWGHIWRDEPPPGRADTPAEEAEEEACEAVSPSGCSPPR
jgi:hypothetical protein